MRRQKRGGRKPNFLSELLEPEEAIEQVEDVPYDFPEDIFYKQELRSSLKSERVVSPEETSRMFTGFSFYNSEGKEQVQPVFGVNDVACLCVGYVEKNTKDLEGELIPDELVNGGYVEFAEFPSGYNRLKIQKKKTFMQGYGLASENLKIAKEGF